MFNDLLLRSSHEKGEIKSSMMKEKTQFIPVKLKERYLLNSQDSEKQTYHLTLDIRGLDIVYRVGDCIRVLPQNDPGIVDKILLSMRSTGDELIEYRKTQKAIQLRTLLLNCIDISNLPYKLVKEVLTQKGVEKEILEKEVRTVMKEMELWDFLQNHPDHRLRPHEICHFLRPMVARFYSIASSMLSVCQEIHLIVTNVFFQKGVHRRFGVATHYLCELLPLEGFVDISLFPAKNFSLPEDKKLPIIMIGAGTGIAPFLGFMQERVHSSSSRRNWLFFGERYKEKDFFYRDFLLKLVRENKLRLTTAFSRDQAEKVYVQHKLLENSREIWEWIEQGAIIYLCGDAKNMAKDVDAALCKIVQQEGKFNEGEAKGFMASMKRRKCYLKEIY